jgi:hypothetical protein
MRLLGWLADRRGHKAPPSPATVTSAVTQNLSGHATDRATAPESERIGLILVGVDGSFVPAFEYLLTHINVIQTSLEFEIVRPDAADPLLKYLSGRGVLPRPRAKELMKGYPDRLAAFLREQIDAFDIKAPPPSHFIIVSMASFDDLYYSCSEPGIGLVALGNWERTMAPPSLREFVVAIVMRRAAAYIAPSIDGSLHMGTKGCLFDFNPLLSDVRLKVLNGHVCHDCARRIAEDGKPALVDDLRHVLGKAWLGTVDDRTSPAAICRKLGYDLFITKGIKPTWQENLISTLQTEGLKELLKIIPTLIVAVAAAAILVMLGLDAAN